jgi:putative flippase GtrA
MKNIKIKKITNLKIFKFFNIGLISTIFDWASFYLLISIININHLISITCSFSIGAIINYIGNKKYTFNCKSKKYVKQISTFFIIAIIALLLSLILLYIFVNQFEINKMFSRIIITFIIFFLNYYVHKKITYNKKYFN